MNNLKAVGVPRSLSKTIFPFEYNDFNYFKKIVEKEKIKKLLKWK